MLYVKKYTCVHLVYMLILHFICIY